jgi:hypothetical protein
MLKKYEIPVTPYSKGYSTFCESNKNRYIQTLSFEELDKIKMWTFQMREPQQF